jgi:hypothetical protein
MNWWDISKIIEMGKNYSIPGPSIRYVKISNL